MREDMSNTPLEDLEELLAKARDEENAAYWRFTRCARGKPVPPEITRRISRLETLISIARYRA